MMRRREAATVGMGETGTEEVTLDFDREWERNESEPHCCCRLACIDTGSDLERRGVPP